MADKPTVCVLALDAADYELLQDFGCNNILLDNHQPLKTKSSPGTDIPMTLHIWPLIATGNEGDLVTEERKWDSSVWNHARRLTRFLPLHIRKKMGVVPRLLGSGLEFDKMENVDDIFRRHGGKPALTGWPGVTDAPRLDASWSLCELMVDNKINERAARGQATEQLYTAIDWLSERPRYNLPLAGTHAHILDVAGHAFASDREVLREWYVATDQAIGELRDTVDQLVILSDHGMQVTWKDDENPGQHSFRAMISTQGMDGELPDRVDDVYNFLESSVEVEHSEPIESTVDREHLEDLGYLE